MIAAEETFSRSEIVRWWEARRLTFNLYVGAVGLVSWLLVLIAGSAAVKPGVDFEEPLAMLVGPFLCGILANFCYCMGWLVDCLFYRATPRKTLFQVGLIFSMALTAFPGIWAVTAWLITVHTGQKLD